MSISRILSIAVLSAFVMTQCGCGSPEKKNEIHMWLVGSEAQAMTIMEIGKDFTAKTGVKVTCQAMSWNDAHTRYLTSIAGDVVPDIGTMGLTWGMEFGELGAMVDLKKEFPDDIAALDKENFQGLVASTKLGEKVFGVPFDITEHIVYYRTDMIQNPPNTWDDLLALLKDLRAKGKGMIIDWGSLEWIGYAPFLWQAGGDFYSSDHKKVMLDTPEAAKALAFLNELYKNGVPKTTVPIEQGMRTGDYPLAISGNWKIVSLELGAPEIKDKWRIAMLPAGPSGKRTAFIGGHIMGVFARSRMKKEAWEFIKYLSTPEAQLKLYNASLETEDSYLPPNMGTWDKITMRQDFKKILQTQAQDANGPPPVLGWDAATRFVNEAVQMVVLKGASPALELKKAAASMQKELDSNDKQ